MKNTLRIITLSVALAFCWGPGCASRSSQSAPDVLQARIDKLKEAVESEVDDPARVKQITAHLEELRDIIAEQAKNVTRREGELVDANASYATSSEQMEQLMNEVIEKKLLVMKTLEEAHFDLQRLVTREEWEAIAKR
jgi:hypothetical protein